jgi:hypothetical protein
MAFIAYPGYLNLLANFPEEFVYCMQTNPDIKYYFQIAVKVFFIYHEINLINVP